MMFRATPFLALVCVLCAGTSQDAAGQALSSSRSHVGVAFTIAPPLGLGVDVAVPIGAKVNLRGGVSAFDVNHDFDNDGITFAGNLKLRSVSAHLDWFPFGGGFHLSPGVMLHNGNEASANALVSGGDEFDLGNERFLSDPSDPVSATVTASFAKRIAPSVRLGWGNIVPRGNRRWSVPFELGVVFSSAPTAALNLGGGACATNGTNCRSVNDAQLQADIQDEQDQINDDLSVLTVIPVVSLGFSIKF
jgi:hypothetical protein